MLGEFDEDFGQNGVHDLLIVLEDALVGRGKYLINEGVCELDEAHLGESLNEEMTRSPDFSNAVGEIFPAVSNQVVLAMVFRRKASQLIDHPSESSITNQGWPI